MRVFLKGFVRPLLFLRVEESKIGGLCEHGARKDICSGVFLEIPSILRYAPEIFSIMRARMHKFILGLSCELVL